MAKVTVACPRCSTRYSVDKKKLGKKARCKQCDLAFMLTILLTPTPKGDALRVGATAKGRKGDCAPLGAIAEGRKCLCKKLMEPLLGYDADYIQYDEASRKALEALMAADASDVVPALRAATFFDELWKYETKEYGYGVAYYVKHGAEAAAKTTRASICQDPLPRAEDIEWMKFFQAKFERVAPHWRSVSPREDGFTPRANLYPLSFRLHDVAWLRQRLGHLPQEFGDLKASTGVLMCRVCGHVQARDAWDHEMTRRARAAGMGEWQNLSASPACLNCGSNNLTSNQTNPTSNQEWAEIAARSRSPGRRLSKQERTAPSEKKWWEFWK